MNSFGGPSWICASIEVRICTPRKFNFWASDALVLNQDLSLPGCMRLPVIWRM